MSLKSLNDDAATVWIGIDVSKDTLDVCLLRATGKEKHKTFHNDAAGHTKLLRWVQHLVGEEVSHFCLESTGSYSLAVAHFLAEAEQRVSIVNPARIKYAGLAQVCGSGSGRGQQDRQSGCALDCQLLSQRRASVVACGSS